MKIEIKEMTGPLGETEWERCEIEIVCSNGEKVLLDLQTDACSAVWITALEHTDRDGQVNDVLEGREWAGRMLERHSPQR